MDRQIKIRCVRCSGLLYCMILFLIWAILVAAAFLELFGKAEWLYPVLLFSGMFLPLAFMTYTVKAEKERVQVCLFGLPVRTLPVSELRLLCSVGTSFVSVLCLSMHSYEDAVQRQKQRMQRSPLQRSELSFIDRDRLVQRFFNRFLRLALGPFSERKTVFLPMDTALLSLLRERYPNLPYRQLAELPYPMQEHCMDGDRAVAVNTMQLHPYTVSFSEDGICLPSGKEPLFGLPAQALRTVLFLDCFYETSRVHPRRRSLIFVSTETVEELAKKVTEPVFGLVPAALSAQLLAEVYAKEQLLRWSKKDRTCLYLKRTDKNVRAIQRFYPEVQRIDRTVQWRKNED